MKSVHRWGVLGAFIFWSSVTLAADSNLPDLGSDTSVKDVVNNAMQRDKVCTRCHDENDDKPVLSIYQTRHGVRADTRTPSCQSCHGESLAHVKNPEGKSDRPKPEVLYSGKHMSTVEAQTGECLQCHQAGLRMNWSGSQHQTRDVACTSCHKVHVARDAVLAKVTQQDVCFTCHKEQRAQTLRFSTHPLAAGKLGCSDCHNPHGSPGPKLLVKNTVNETCYMCHAEKRGPFMWEHPPVVDDCMNCHTPHGSTNSPLLKARPPWLCQQCHGWGAPHPGQVYSAANLPDGEASNMNINPGAGASATNPITGKRVTNSNPEPRLAFRGCPNCHSQIHGSNNPGGNRFLR